MKTTAKPVTQSVALSRVKSSTSVKAKRQAGKPVPALRSDKQAEDFVASADLSQYDLSGFSPMRFELEAKSSALHLRLPSKLLEAIKLKAKDQGIPYTRYVRHVLEAQLAR